MQTYRQTDKQTDRQMDMQRSKETYRYTGSQEPCVKLHSNKGLYTIQPILVDSENLQRAIYTKWKEHVHVGPAWRLTSFLITQRFSTCGPVADPEGGANPAMAHIEVGNGVWPPRGRKSNDSTVKVRILASPIRCRLRIWPPVHPTENTT